MRFRLLSVLLLAVTTTCAVFALLFLTGYLHLQIVDTTRSFLNKGSKGVDVEVEQDIWREMKTAQSAIAPTLVPRPSGHVAAFDYDDDNSAGRV
ncbi:hypothetical protein B0I75DRAFT_136021, partial [Yarrowia lipolytica]